MPGDFKSTFSLALGVALLVQAAVSLSQTPATQLQLMTDRTRIKAGERVRVSIVPSKVAQQYSFAVGFQDGPVEVLPLGQNEIEHDYLVPGTYTVSVIPRPSDEAVLRAPDFSSSRIIVHVDGAPMIAEPESLKAGEPVKFTIDIASPKGSKTQFRFNFGDGSSTGWREDRQITYTYTQPEVYTARGEVLREGWAQPLATMPVEINVYPAARASESARSSAGSEGFVGSPAFWALIAAGLATTTFAVIKLRQSRRDSVPSYELHRAGSAGNIQSSVAPEILLEVVLIPGIASGRHYVSKIETSRTPADRRTNG
jgi:hypothetical protein